MFEENILKSEKDCATMLGITLEDYHASLENIKIKPFKNHKNTKYDNSILKELGLTEKDLKVRGN